MKPFNFEEFYNEFIFGHPLLAHKKSAKKKIPKADERKVDVPEEWKKKFSIFKEVHPGKNYVSWIFEEIIRSLMFQTRVGTADNYQTTYNSLKRFRGNIPVTDITPRFLKEYESWMLYERKNSKTTVGIYTRVIRAVINEAIELKLMKREDYPFGRRRYRVLTGRNIKKALDQASIAKLYYSEALTESQLKAKDYWFFSFYGNGMNIKDVITLQYKNIKGEYLVFERAKTELSTSGDGVTISCFINQDMWDIIERRSNKDKSPDNYIFPILTPGESPLNQFLTRQKFVQFINKNMQKVKKPLNIDKKVNTMETRHSASTIMKNAGVSPHFIKESLGHTSLKTTENYLAGFENEQRKEFAKVLEDFKKLI